MAKPKSWKCQCCGIATLAIGTIVLIMGIAFPFIIDSLVPGAAKDAATVTEDHSKNWQHVPGPYDLLITRGHYLYNLTNWDDLMFKGEKPVFEEFGPYFYREYDDFEDPEWVDG